MIWAVLAIGISLTVFGATAGAALIAISRVELTRAASRQLRGAAGALTRLGRLDTLLAAASTATAFGVVILGAALPAAFSGSRWWLLALLGMFIAVPVVLFGGYLFPRRVTQPRAQSVAARVIPILEVWAGVLRWMLPVRRGGRALPALRDEEGRSRPGRFAAKSPSRTARDHSVFRPFGRQCSLVVACEDLHGANPRQFISQPGTDFAMIHKWIVYIGINHCPGLTYSRRIDNIHSHFGR